MGDARKSAVQALTEAHANTQASFSLLRKELVENGASPKTLELLERLETSHSRLVQLLQGSFIRSD